ncbi:hypothetical protein N9064_00340 [bacterium]|nr:hypothetical protein [bacterium]
MNNSNGSSGGGGQLVSQLMQEINSSTGNNDNTAYTDQEYNPQIQQEQTQSQAHTQSQAQAHGEQSFNPDMMVPPPREDDMEEYNQAISDDEDEDSDEEEYYYKESNLADALSQFGGEYTSFVMDLLKNSVIIFIGYIIFSHPFTHNYIMQFAAMIPGLQDFLAIPTYYLAFNGLLFVIFYFIVSYFI